jgi:hypothetical protein
MRRAKFVIAFLILFSICEFGFAKRAAPKEVEPVVDHGVINALQIKDGNLFVQTEHGDRFIVNLKTHEVKKQ